MEPNYVWKYCSLGGVIRVRISSGEDIANLGSLDQKLWTVLSCPTDGLEFDPMTLSYIDSDKDGKIKVCEMVEAAEWLTSVIKDKDLILKGDSVLPLDQIDCSNECGRNLHDSARQILVNLGLEKDEICLQDASDSVAIFANTKFNGDGVITAASTDDAVLKKQIEDCMAMVGSSVDRSGEAGVNTDQIEAFYAACADYSAWQELAETDSATIFPYGDNTAAALDACNALKDKLADYFTRCKLLAYDKDAAAAVAVSVTDINNIGDCPIALPSADLKLPLTGINPAWQAAFAKFRALVLDVDFSGEDSIDESQWNACLAKLAPYVSWLGSKKGAAVEAMGIEAVREVLASGRKQDLLDLIAQDKALEKEANSIDAVKKLMYLYRDFYRLLNNYVNFTDFYSRNDGSRAIFEAGQLYIDQRCCDLCVKIKDMGKHADVAKNGGMFLIYCKCENKVLAQTMDIVAVMTDGSISELRPGKNGVFYDLKGRAWDAVITKIVDNPISIKQAFWSPYRKFWELCVGLINKSAADKDSKMMADMQAKAKAAAAAPPPAPGTDAAAAAAAAAKPQPFDIAKFAGIFAAIGMALGYIGSFITSLIEGVSSTPVWKLALAVIGIMLVISGPACFMAWSKLRTRNMGPVLNANGWAINSKVLVNILFGGKLTTVAKYPKLKIADPYRQKSKAGWWIAAAVIVALGAVAAWYFFGR